MRFSSTSPVLLLPLLAGFFLSASVVSGSPQKPGASDRYQKEIQPILEEYCYDCHGEGRKKGGLSLDGDGAFADTKHWYAIWKNLQTQMMPPSEKAQPSPEKRTALLRWIEKEVFRLDPANPDPGRVTIRRLNREEYKNSVLDLLGVQFDTAEAFPPDDTGYGFDTVGDVLAVSPLLLERYLQAASEVARKAAVESGPRIPSTVVTPWEWVSPDGKKRPVSSAQVPFADTARSVRYFPAPPAKGRYRVTASFRVTGSAEATDNTVRVLMRLGKGAEGGKGDPEVAAGKLGWEFKKELVVESEVEVEPGGQRCLSVELAPDQAPREGQRVLSAQLMLVTLTGPLDGSHMEYGPSYRRVFLDGPPPDGAAEKSAYRRKILEHLAYRAYRRPVDARAVDRLVKVAEAGEKEAGGRFDEGIARGLVAILGSPRFLFRAEIQPEPNNPGKVVPVDEYALASRLSYFLWSSLPDGELLQEAAAGTLRKNLRKQVDRMLADARVSRFVDNFVGQWLQSRDVLGANIELYPIFGDKPPDFGQIRAAMKEETEELFAHVLREKLPLVELLTARYAFLNEKLAKFYGIDGVQGAQIRRVDLPEGSPRLGGILTQGTTLLVTSNPTRTSPVKRGLFILDNLLGSPPPPPPANVPQLEAVKKRGSKLTMREAMELHRKEPLCASCHARMDPLGLALENFTPAGNYRDKDGDKPVETAGKLITGESFGTPTELARVIATARSEDFYRCVAEKLLTYALGRGMEHYDTVTVAGIVEQFKKEQGTLRALVDAVVESAPFQKRRGDGTRLAGGN
jgi:mono/diheme cytochrome c family protein